MLEDVIVNCGDGVVCAVQIPPGLAIANILLPSADAATANHEADTLFDFHVRPKSDDKKSSPGFADVTSLLPSAEQAMELK